MRTAAADAVPPRPTLQPLAVFPSLPPDTPPLTSLLRVLVVDDDAAARAHMLAVLARQPDVRVVGASADGRTAVDAIRAEAPDLVFLDVQMPELDGFGVVAEIGVGAMPPVVFTSAYAEFAVRAFEAYALDYVLKPFDDARFLAALERGRAQVVARAGARAAAAAPPSSQRSDVDGPPSTGADPRLLALLEQLARPAAATRYPDAVAVKVGGQYVVVRIDDVDWIEADGNYARLYVQQRPRLISKSLATLEREVLDPSRFVRVHRSSIVQVARIASVEPAFHGDVTLILKDGTRIDCSRRYRERLEERLYFTT